MRTLQLERGLSDRESAPIDPFLIPDMAAAARRILAAVDAHERVGIFGDYDCDGITSTAQVVRFLRRNGIEPHVRLPHRVEDGYGLSRRIIDEFIAQGITLLITVDTGVSSSAEIAHAADHGIDVVVVDHHQMLERPARAVAVVHPALGPAFPLPHPAAAGVVYLLLRALEGEKWEEQETDAALAALGIVADLVPLTGYNRLLVRDGLRALQSITHGPLAQMVHDLCPSGTVTSTDIAFRIAPRINAAGRMARADIALHALLHGGAALEELERLNTHRQQQTADFVQEVMHGLRAERAMPLLVSAGSDRYPHGIIGLLAGKLTESFGRPSIVATFADGKGTASLRSTDAYSIANGLAHCRELLTTFGGHAQAGGCTFPIEHWPRIVETLHAHVKETTDPDALIPAIDVDAMLAPTDLTVDFHRALMQLAPFGQGNPEPLFLLRGVTVDQARIVGSDGQHLQARIGGTKAIGFGLGGLIAHFTGPVDVACRIGIDTWNGRMSLQLFIVDIRPAARAESVSGAVLAHEKTA